MLCRVRNWSNAIQSNAKGTWKYIRISFLKTLTALERRSMRFFLSSFTFNRSASSSSLSNSASAAGANEFTVKPPTAIKAHTARLPETLEIFLLSSSVRCSLATHLVVATTTRPLPLRLILLSRRWIPTFWPSTNAEHEYASEEAIRENRINFWVGRIEVRLLLARAKNAKSKILSTWRWRERERARARERSATCPHENAPPQLPISSSLSTSTSRFHPSITHRSSKVEGTSKNFFLSFFYPRRKHFIHNLHFSWSWAHWLLPSPCLLVLATSERCLSAGGHF